MSETQTAIPLHDSQSPPAAPTAPVRDRRPPEIRMVAIGQMDVDPEIQREYKPTQAHGIAKEFDPNALGVLTLSDREDDGSLWIVDGQHRWQAMGLLDFDPAHEVVCKVCYGLTRPEEAKLFRLLNNTRRPNPIALFNIAVVEGEPIASDIKDVLTRAQWRVGAGEAGTGRFMAVSAARDVYKLAERRHNNEPGWGMAAFERVVMILTRAWRLSTPGSMDALMVKGLGFVLLMNWNMDDDTMVEKLAAHPAAARGVLARVEGQAVAGITKQEALVDYLISYYNEGMAAKRRLIKHSLKTIGKPQR